MGSCRNQSRLGTKVLAVLWLAPAALAAAGHAAGRDAGHPNAPSVQVARSTDAGTGAQDDVLLAASPQDSGARDGLRLTQAALAGDGPRYEAGIWLGRTELPSGLTGSGLRYAEFAAWTTPNTRLFARFDDGLSQDNAALVRTGESAALKSVGAYHRWLERHGTLLEFGMRSLPGGIDQKIYRFEQSLYLDRGYEARLGGWAGPRSDDRTERLVYLGGSLPLSRQWRVEPTYFSSRNGAVDDQAWRFLLATQYTFRSGFELGAGIASGRTTNNGIARTVREGHLRGTYALTPRTSLQWLARRETVEGGDSTTVLAIGTALNWR